MGKVLVFGSFVVDLMSRTPHLPVPGETVKGSVFKMGPGGKGFNQGVAAHKAGANLVMVTKLGKDTFGDVALKTMKDLKMNADYIFQTDEAETGAALIMVDENTSQNEIVVVLGTCNQITDQEVDSLSPVLEESEYLLTQLETNVSAVERIVALAEKKGVKVILNPAPVQKISDMVLSKIDIITPNEVEAEILTGIPVTDEEIALRAVRFLDKINKNHEVIDSKNIPAEGFSEKYRGYLSHHLIHAVTNRIDAALEEISGHDMDLRRYYRKVEY